jgi:hypothetical protein
MTTIHDELFGLNFCPACGKEAKKAVAHCVSCGVDFSSVLRVLDNSTPNPTAEEKSAVEDLVPDGTIGLAGKLTWGNLTTNDEIDVAVIAGASGPMCPDCVGLEERLETVERHVMNLLAKLIELGVDVR